MVSSTQQIIDAVLKSKIEAKTRQILAELSIMQTTQQADDDIKLAVWQIWEKMGRGIPEVTICDSPLACSKACPNPEDYSKYWSLTQIASLAMFQAAKELGCELDEENYNIFKMYVECCPFLMFTETQVYVSRRPEELHFDDDNLGHNDSGPMCKFPDGWSTWSIHGVAVDEQIVMSPETQTLVQMRDEKDPEVKRIRIERYGVAKYESALLNEGNVLKDLIPSSVKDYLLGGSKKTQ